MTKFVYIGLANTLQGYAITELALRKNLEEDFERILFDNKLEIEVIKNKLMELEFESVILDLDTFIDEELKIISDIEAIRKAKNCDVYLVACDFKENSNLISTLQGLGYKKIITCKTQGEIRDNFIDLTKQTCEYITDDDYIKLKESFNERLKDENPVLAKVSELTQNKKTVTIGVAGCINRIGTTTSAIQLAKALNVDGNNNACVIENNNNKLIDTYVQIAEENSFEVIDNDGAKIKNLDIYRNIKKINNIKKQEYKYLIYDYGAIDLDNDDSLFDKDIIIFVCGCKPSEIINATKITTACVKDFGITNAFYLYNFISEQQYNELLDIQSSMLQKYTFRLDFTPDPFVLNNSNATAFANILEIAFNEEPVKKSSILKRILGR